MKIPSPSSLTPLSQIVALAVFIFVIENGIMLLFSVFGALANLDWLIKGLIDSATLVIVASPLLYLHLFRPLNRQTTERLVAEETVKTSEAKYRSLFQYANDAIYIFDPETHRILDANERASEQVGYTHQELQQMVAEDLLAPSVTIPPEAILSDPHKHRTSRFETVHRRKDGTVFPVEASGRMVEYGGKRVVQTFIRDLTPRKEAEELFRTFSQSAPIGVYVIQNGRFRSANPQFILATGYTEEELIGMESLSLVLPQFREIVREETINALKGKRSTPVEYQVMSKSGKTMWAMETVASISYKGKRAVIGSFVDITERKRMEDALQSSLDKLARNARQLLALSEASHAIQRAGSLKEIYRTVLQQISKLNYQASLYTLTEDSRHLVIAASTIRPSILKPVEKLTGTTFKGFRFPVTPGTFYEQIITGGETILLSPYAKAVEEALPAALRPLAGAIVQLLDLKEGIGARLNVGGKPYGMLTITGAGLTEDDRQAVSTFANHISIAIEKTLLLQRVQEMAITDDLTGLYNHRHFHELLDMEAKRARRYKHCLSLVMSDIDHFKSVNDTFGHPVGDTVLKSVAEIFTKAARETDHVARYGGEEFAIILPETSDSEAAVIAERIRRAVEDKEIVVSSTSIRFTISMGVAATQGEQEGTVQALVQRADKALYQAKRLGRNRVCTYSEGRGTSRNP